MLIKKLNSIRYVNWLIKKLENIWNAITNDLKQELHYKWFRRNIRILKTTK